MKENSISDFDELKAFHSKNLATQLLESDDIIKYTMSPFQLATNPPRRITAIIIFMIVGAYQILIGNNLIAAMILISATIILLIIAIKSITASRNTFIVAIKGTRIGCGTETKINWFPSTRITKISSSFGVYKIIHLDTGHQFIIPKAFFKQENLSHLLNMGNQRQGA